MMSKDYNEELPTQNSTVDFLKEKLDWKSV